MFYLTLKRKQPMINMDMMLLMVKVRVDFHKIFHQVLEVFQIFLKIFLVNLLEEVLSQDNKEGKI